MNRTCLFFNREIMKTVLLNQITWLDMSLCKKYLICIDLLSLYRIGPTVLSSFSSSLSFQKSYLNNFFFLVCLFWHACQRLKPYFLVLSLLVMLVVYFLHMVEDIIMVPQLPDLGATVTMVITVINPVFTTIISSPTQEVIILNQHR